MTNIPTLTARQIAGKLNRAKRKGLTAEGRQRLREAALAAKPWHFATGPKSLEGKRKSAANGRRRQKGEFSARQILATTAEINRMIRSLSELRHSLPIDKSKHGSRRGMVPVAYA
jgi:hypothetical protein